MARKKHKTTDYEDVRFEFLQVIANTDPRIIGELIGKDSQLNREYLAVLVSFVLDNDPDFVNLIAKYRKRRNLADVMLVPEGLWR